MLSKKSQLIAVLMITVILNIIIVIKYLQEYDPDYFDNSRFYQKKYRCIRYFIEKEFNKFAHKSCERFADEYTLFLISRYRYTYLSYLVNVIMSSLFIIVYFT